MILTDHRIALPQGQFWVTSWLVSRYWPSSLQSEIWDFVIIQTNNDGMMFAQLLFVFRCLIPQCTHQNQDSIMVTAESQPPQQEAQVLTLVHPFDVKILQCEQLRKDWDLGFIWVWTHQKKESHSISVKSIIRGALVVKDHSKDCRMVDDWLVVEISPRMNNGCADCHL